ncbi:hypothetical protein ACWGDE_07725 [Streptomyces sp. NPDC054956]
MQRGRVLLRPELADCEDAVRLAADTGEHRAAVEHVYATARADGLAARRAVFMALYGLAHIDGCVLRATHAQIAERAAMIAARSISPASVEKYLREFRAKNLLLTLEGGLSPEANAKLGGEGPRVPLYALVVPVALDDALPARTPLQKGRDARAREAALGRRVRKALGIPEPVEELSDLTRPAVFPGNDSSSASVENCMPVDELSDPNHSRRELVVFPRPRSRRGAAGPGRTPRSRRGETSPTRKTSPAHLVAEKLTGHVVLRKISSERRVRLVRPFANAGWSAADVLFALEQQPDGTRHISTQAVRHPLSWAAYRLGLWLDEAGIPVPSRFQQLAQAAGRPDAPRPVADPTEPTWDNERAQQLEPEPANNRFKSARAALAQAQEIRRALKAAQETQARRATEAQQARMPLLDRIDAAFEARRASDDHQAVDAYVHRHVRQERRP